ncbi:MAG: D-inositol 3-phosphate glycosyltransferase [Rhodobiaceae bacterium UBA7378]|nr:MAG: D-inositol 3-phosphate glycosyltransferase [Rhodobiaceae bacterium UBA7378]
MTLPQAYPDLTGVTVAQIIPRLNVGGAETTTLEIARALRAANARALVVSEGGDLLSALQEAGAETINMPVASKNPAVMLANIKRLRRLVAAESVDILHARSRAPAWSTLAAARAQKMPMVTTYHSLVHERPRAKVLYNSVMARGDIVIANSEYTGDMIRRVHGIDDARLRIVPRGCDASALAPENFTVDMRAAKRREWGATAEDFVILCPARITEVKGQHILLGAMAQLPANTKAFVVFAGSADGRPEFMTSLERQVAATSLSARVHFAGLVRDMPCAYAASDLAIVPTVRSEPFGRTIIEAQAAGLPVIASNAGGYRETVVNRPPEDGGTGWLVPPNDSDALAQAIGAAMNQSAKARAKMVSNGRARVAENFQQEVMCARTLAIYAELVREAHGNSVRGAQDV